MTNQPETAPTTSRRMPWWGTAGWVVLLVQMIGFSLAFDGTPGMDVSPQAIAVALIAFSAGVAGLAVFISRRSRP